MIADEIFDKIIEPWLDKGKGPLASPGGIDPVPPKPNGPDPGPPVVDYPLREEELPMWVKYLAGLGGAVWYDSEQLDIKKGPDGVHLFPSGYRFWAEKIWPWMATRVS